MAEVRGSERPRANMMIAKGAVERNTITLALDVMLVVLVYLLNNGNKCILKSGKEVYGLLEETVREVASIAA